MLSGIVMLVIPVDWKTLLPMLVTLAGIDTLERFVQPSKALSPILVTFAGIERLERFVHL